jgi:hypothetical protein
MLRRYYKPILCVTGFCLIIYIIWYSVLILDDFHPAFNNSPQSISGSQKQQLSMENDLNPAAQLDKPDSSNIPVEAFKKGFYIYVNLDEIMMYVYKNGELLKTYPVSGGNQDAPSPLGTWKVVTKETWGEGFGGAWMGINVPWGTYGIHGTIYPWLIGKSNSSQGCIRMKSNDAKELFKLIPYGTIVTISYRNVPFRTLKTGCIGSDVLDTQKALKKLRYYQGYPDGVFGDLLKKAVLQFQKDNRLHSTGYIDKRTYNLILQEAQQSDEVKTTG